MTVYNCVTHFLV